MSETEQDDFTIQIEPLSAPAAPCVRIGGMSPFARRYRPAQRVRRGLFASALVLATLLALLATTPEIQASVTPFERMALGLSSSPAALPLGSAYFLFEHTVPWGVLRADGREIPRLAPQGMSAQSAVLTLPPGRHTLSYTATPFPPLTCAVSVPAEASDTCPLGALTSTLAALYTGQIALGAARVLDLGAVVAALPRAAHIQLEDAVQLAFDQIATSTISLATGDHYLNAGDQVTTAREPLIGAARFMLTTNLADGPALSDCAPYCPDAAGARQGTDDERYWRLSAPVLPAPEWHFTRASNGSLVEVVPSAPPSTTGYLEVRVGARWMGAAWQAVILEQDAFQDERACGAGGMALGMLPVAPNTTGGGSVVGLASHPASSPRPECVLEARLTSSSSFSRGMGATQVYVLVRCGLLLTTSPEGRQIFPGLLYASPHEQALTQEIVATPLL